MQLEFKGSEANYPPELVKALCLMNYKPGSALYLTHDSTGEVYVVPLVTVEDVRDGQSIRLNGHAVHCDSSDNLRGLLSRLFESFKSIEAHECAEQFTYRGVHVCNPHLKLQEREALWDEALGLAPARAKEAQEAA